MKIVIFCSLPVLTLLLQILFSVEAVVEFDYKARENDELTIRKGDVITNITRQPGGWWEGTLKGKRGMFPDNFVKVRTYFIMCLSVFIYFLIIVN